MLRRRFPASRASQVGALRLLSAVPIQVARYQRVADWPQSHGRSGPQVEWRGRGAAGEYPAESGVRVGGF